MARSTSSIDSNLYGRFGEDDLVDREGARVSRLDQHGRRPVAPLGILRQVIEQHVAVDERRGHPASGF